MQVQANPAKTWSNQMGEMRQAYEAGTESRWLERPRDWPYSGAGSDWHIRYAQEYFYLLEMARNIENNDPVVSQGVGRFVTNVVQGGYKFSPKTGVDWIDRLQEERWLSYTDDSNYSGVDYEERVNWHDLEKLTVRRIIFDGDIGVAPMETGQLRTFEAHRIRSPDGSMGLGQRDRRRIFHGVETDRKGRIVRYWVNPESQSEVVLSRKVSLNGIPAWQFDPLTGVNERNFFHLGIAKRLSQSRYVTTLAPVLNTAGMHGDIQFAKLLQQQMVSYLGFQHDIPLSASDTYTPPISPTIYDPKTGQMRPAPLDMAPGSEYWPTYPGEKLVPLEANVPNPEFFEQAKMMLMFIACNLDMPLIFFLLDASETNFSAWRGAGDQFKMSAMEFQRSHAAMFHRPTIRFHQRRWLRQDAALRRAFDVIGPDFFNHEWEYPRWQYIEPLKDVQADLAEIGGTLNSPRRVAARRNLRYETIVEESCIDRAQMIRCALDHAAELNTHPYVVENPDERITWREIAHPPMPQGLQMQVLEKATADDPAEDNSAVKQGSAT